MGFHSSQLNVLAVFYKAGLVEVSDRSSIPGLDSLVKQAASPYSSFPHLWGSRNEDTSILLHPHIWGQNKLVHLTRLRGAETKPKPVQPLDWFRLGSQLKGLNSSQLLGEATWAHLQRRSVTATLQRKGLYRLLLWANFKMTNTPYATELFTFLPLPDVIGIS